MSAVEVHRSSQSWVQKTQGVCGGDACIRDTRVPVWSLVVARRQGTSDDDLRDYFVTPLSAADIAVAWEYSEVNREEIDQAIRQNQEA